MDRKLNSVDEASSLVAHERCARSAVTRQDASSTLKSKQGQAMAELLVGLVAIMLLVVGLQQISIVSQKSFTAYSNARTQLAEQLADDSLESYSGDFIFVETVDAGPDQKNYTGDDRVVMGDDSFYTEGRGFLHAVDYAELNGRLDDYARVDPYYRLSDSSFSVLSKSFAMHYASDVQAVEILPFLRNALGRDTVNLQREIFMPSWKGLMNP